jgi:hypothetical protein
MFCKTKQFKGKIDYKFKSIQRLTTAEKHICSKTTQKNYFCATKNIV